MAERYPIPAAAQRHATTIHRSQFLCIVFPCFRVEDLHEVLRAERLNHPQAVHHCHAFILGAPGGSAHSGASDDGEPAGTAGKPMLATLRGSGLGDVAAVVTRYFGGVKLGTGGLVRAYSGVVAETLGKVERGLRLNYVSWQLHCPYALYDRIHKRLLPMEAQFDREEFAEEVALHLRIPQDRMDLFHQLLEEFPTIRHLEMK
jgi:uncharacterized YigZ family protein